jgi:hypothetical protein
MVDMSTTELAVVQMLALLYEVIPFVAVGPETA